MQLNRDRIHAAAFDILSEYGLGDLTMRRLAKTLEVAPGALYWHYPSKQE
ncbi:MAG: TetR/AcrR family transcriptional regulator, partial [Corynebacterium sp.]|nr:TetR/AcrR family transcriptional regulator [Corynebacterium sp.]